MRCKRLLNNYIGQYGYVHVAIGLYMELADIPARLSYTVQFQANFVADIFLLHQGNLLREYHVGSMP